MISLQAVHNGSNNSNYYLTQSYKVCEFSMASQILFEHKG
jgi:hypothetical protein